MELVILLFMLSILFYQYLMSSYCMQVESIDLTEKRGKEGDHEIFRRSAFEDKSASSPIDADGLPFVGQVTLICFPFFY